jgi:hypothetical protein
MDSLDSPTRLTDPTEPPDQYTCLTDPPKSLKIEKCEQFFQMFGFGPKE